MPDFATMDREALNAFRKNAEKRNQKPAVDNNYFTAKPRGQRCPQPSDWIPTCIATEWCEYHGPCKHKPEDCNIIAAGSLAEFQKQKVQKNRVDLKTSLRMRKEIKEEYVMLKEVERMKKRAAADKTAGEDGRMKKRAAAENTTGEDGPATKKRKN